MAAFADHIRLTIEEQRQLQKSFEKDLTVQAQSTTVSHDDTTPDNRTGHSGTSPRRGRFRGPNKKMSRQLIDAAEAGNLADMRHCIAAYADVNYQSKKEPPEKEGMTAVHMAARNGHHAAVEILIENRANLNVTEPSQYNTALHYAAANGYSAIVQTLVRSGANTDARNHRGLTPLLMATSEAIQVDFLEAGTNPNIRGTDAETVLHYAAYFGFKEAVSLLIAKKAEIDARNTLEQTPLWLVCANTSIPEVKSLAIAKLLLESGASPNVVSKVADRTPFDEALRRKHFQLLRLLLKKGADHLSRPSGELYPLHRAAQDGQVQALRELIPYYDSIDIRDPDENYTALHVAIASNQQACTRVLVRLTSRLNMAGKDGLAPIHLAFKLARASICKDVLEEHVRRGVTQNQVDNGSQRLPIYWARTAQAVEVWVKYGGELNWKGKDGISPLHHAVLYHDVAVVEALIKHGASCELLDDRGYNTIEALCLEETRWTITFDQRLAILRLLIDQKHTTFTEKCRTIIGRWNDKQVQARLTKQLPWRSVGEMAGLAASYAPLPLMGIVGLAILGARRPGD
jgi:ankyrin repeat protein